MKKDSKKRIREFLSGNCDYQNTPEEAKTEVLQRVGYPADETEPERNGQPLGINDDLTYKFGFCEEAVERFL